MKGSTLKLIAIIAMFMDHIGVGILQPLMLRQGVLGVAASGITTILQLPEGPERNLAILWWVMRKIIGRIAFPIFCFFLVEGFLHTKNVVKYAGRLFLFALLSEIPFNLCISHKLGDARHQNVFFTLLIALLCMQGVKMLDDLKEKGKKRLFLVIAGQLGVVVLASAIAQFLRTDYGAQGVLLIVILYFFRYLKGTQSVAGGVASYVFLGEPAAALAFPLLYFYNGQRGLKMKYFFYLFYPLHLLLLYGLCMMLGLSYQG